MKSIPAIRIYALAVCFVSIICIAITAGFALYNFVTVLAPELTIQPFRIQALSSNEQFINNPGLYMMPSPPQFGREGLALTADRQNPFAGMSEAEITALRLERLQTEYASHTRSAVQSLIRQGIIILISSILYFVHWRLAKTIGIGIADNSAEQ